MKKLFVVALFVVFCALAYSAVANEPQRGEPRSGGTAVVSTATDPGGLNPAITTQGGVHLLCGSIFSGLVATDFDFNPVPDLAERWMVSPDGKIYTFFLARAAEFHDGRPVTSEDVKFTFEQLLLKYHSRTRASVGDKLQRILTPDPHTVVFEFNRPYAAFLQLVDVTNAPVMPKHLFENTDPLNNPHNTRPVGSGPFRFHEWAKGDRITLVKNERYFKTGKPYLERVVYKITPSAATAAIAFENGEIDYFLNPTPLDIQRLSGRTGVVVTDRGREGFATVETVVLNLNRPPLSDVRVRQAMAHAIDKNYIVEKIAFGHGKIAVSPISSLLRWAHNPRVKIYERDLELANRMLDEAGYRRDPAGVRFHLKAVYAPSYGKIIEALRDHLREAGIILDLEQMEFSAAVDRVYIKKDFDVGFASFENGPDPDIGVKRTVISSNIGRIPFSNGAGYRNPRVDELFELAASEMDQAKRAAYYFEAQEILARDVPYLWIYEPQSMTAYRAGLRGMYEWSAKSSVYFARDAWWAEDGAQSSAPFGRRQIFFLLIAGIVVVLGAALLVLRRRRRV